MSYRPLFWKLFPAFLFVTVLSVATLAYLSYLTLRDFHMGQSRDHLEKLVDAVSNEVRGIDQPSAPLSLQRTCEKLAGQFDVRVTLVASDGTVTCESHFDPGQMDNHGSRSEVLEAKRLGKGSSARFSNTLQREYLYVASSVAIPSQNVSYVRVAMPLDAMENSLSVVYFQAGLGAIVLVIVLVLVSWGLSRSLARPIKAIKQQALRIADGRFSEWISHTPGEAREHVDLALAINTMASELDHRIKMLTQKSQEQEAIFSSMVEGVVSIDHEGRILTINRSAQQILSLSQVQVGETRIQEIVRIPQLDDIIESCIRDERPAADDFLLDKDKTRYLYMQASPITGLENKGGVVLVINDMTKLKELEQHRKDFVANVSHELRTPLTSIQGFSETILTNLENTDQKTLKEFLEIINSHSNRLTQILQDLLDLARIEKDTDYGGIALERQKLNPVFDDIKKLYAMRLGKKKQTLVAEVETDLEGRLNAPLLESAISNLIDNAIKYSPEGSEIRLSAGRNDQGIYIRVADEGVGIPADHIPRLFERFYRVDRARSRNLGGTGLGLSIVKHIILAHHGHVGVDSTPGKGSVFEIRLPFPGDEDEPVGGA